MDPGGGVPGKTEKESSIHVMIFLLKAISEHRRISLKELSSLARAVERPALLKWLNVLVKGEYIRKKKEIDGIYYYLTSTSDLLAKKDEKEIRSKLRWLLAKIKPKPWERRLDIIQFIAEKGEATFTEIYAAMKERYLTGCSKANIYKDLEQMRMKEHLVISKYSTKHENVYRVGKAAVLEPPGLAEDLSPAAEKRVLGLQDQHSKSRELWTQIGGIAVPWIIIEGTGEFAYNRGRILSRYVDLPLVVLLILKHW